MAVRRWGAVQRFMPSETSPGLLGWIENMRSPGQSPLRAWRAPCPIRVARAPLVVSPSRRCGRFSAILYLALDEAPRRNFLITPPSAVRAWTTHPRNVGHIAVGNRCPLRQTRHQPRDTQLWGSNGPPRVVGVWRCERDRPSLYDPTYLSQHDDQRNAENVGHARALAPRPSHGNHQAGPTTSCWCV